MTRVAIKADKVDHHPEVCCCSFGVLGGKGWL